MLKLTEDYDRQLIFFHKYLVKDFHLRVAYLVELLVFINDPATSHLLKLYYLGNLERSGDDGIIHIE